MTRLLASVTGIHEAVLAMTGGADIIDLKEPSRGVLGAVSHDVQREVVQRVKGRRPVSATVGDLPMNPETIVSAIRRTASNGVDLVKIGLRDLERHSACLDALAEASSHGIRVVAVLFAEDQPTMHLPGSLHDAGCHGIMLDTAEKGSGRLVQHMDMRVLGAFVDSARSLGLLTGLAGSLQPGDIGELRKLGPDYLGFRGALCEEGARTGRLSKRALSRVRMLLNSPADDCTDHRLMAN